MPIAVPFLKNIDGNRIANSGVKVN